MATIKEWDIPYANILDIGLEIGLKVIRLRPGDGWWGTFVNISSLVIAATFIVSTFMYFFEIEGDIDKLAMFTEALTTYSITFIKFIPLLIYKQRIQGLFDLTVKFWNPQNYPEIMDDVKKIYKSTYYFLMGYECVWYSTLLFFYVQPFFKYELLITSHVPPQIPHAFEIMLVVQYYIAFTLASVIAGFDAVYVAYFAHLVVQLKCLNNAMTNIDMESPDFNNILSKYLDHHRFILDLAEQLMDIVAIPLLGQYMISTYLTCMELYLLSSSFGNPMRLILSISYTTSLLFQFGCYCFSATDFTEEAALMSDATYMSRWYDGTPSQQKMLGFVILRSQKEVKCKAGGLAEIDRKAWMSVIRTAVSFYTLMRQFKGEGA